MGSIRTPILRSHNAFICFGFLGGHGWVIGSGAVDSLVQFYFYHTRSFVELRDNARESLDVISIRYRCM